MRSICGLKVRRHRRLLGLHLLWLVLTVALGGCSSSDDGESRPGGSEPDAGDSPFRIVCKEANCVTGMTCDAEAGICVASCNGMQCRSGQRCEVIGSRAECKADCAAVDCDEDETCDDSGPAAVCVSQCAGACGEGQRCDASAGTTSCKDVACAELDCKLPKTCVEAEDGKGGHVCVDISCESDLQCKDGQFCVLEDSTGSYCKGTACSPGARRCTNDGQAVEECLSNGSAWFERFACPAAACVEGSDEAHCPCVDDWSCAAFTACEVDRCEGTGVAPKCFVSVVAMEEALPSQEFQWGTNSGVRADLSMDSSEDILGEGHPLPQSVQVVNVPMVANLTDDNGDGQVNELDYPEIVFLSYCGGSYLSDGMLRAIHGGGVSATGERLAGKDYFAATGAACNPASGCDPADPASWLVWNEGDALDALKSAYANGTNDCAPAQDAFDSTSTLAIGNLDNDPAGYPEIVVMGERGADYVYIFDSRGHFVARSQEQLPDHNSGAPVIANLDGQGLPEIVLGRYVWTLKLEAGRLGFDKLFVGDGMEAATNGALKIGPVSCVADLDQDGRQEVIAGAAAYDFPDPAACSATPCTMTARWRADIMLHDGYCAVADVWGANTTAAPHPTANPLDGKPEVVVVRSGTIFVINASDGSVIRSYPIAGTGGGPLNIDDFDGDSMPEVGTAGSVGYSVVDFQEPNALDGQTPSCPPWPNLLDVDNPLVGTFASDRGPYPAPDPAAVGNAPRVVPTQADGSAIACKQDADCNPGIDPFVFACNESTSTCVCLHNGWTRKTQDRSSESTGSSVFDFNGDGAAEVIYNDECFFRIFDGTNGRLYSRIPSESRTRAEYPVVADLDNDGNAEIVFGVSNESKFCQGAWESTTSAFAGAYFKDAMGNTWPNNPYQASYNAGLEVWGEPRDLWVSARRIWNQHSYHVTNVTEGGSIPAQETASWSSELRTTRGLNSYRSNPPSRAGVAPDLQVVEVSVAASGGGCSELGDEIAITARIRNAGDLRVGADIKVAFVGSWGSTEAPLAGPGGAPLTTTLGSPLRAGGELLVRVTYDAAGKAPAGLPDFVTVIVDPDDEERECDDADDMDNQRKVAVTRPEPAPDLWLSIDEVTGDCPDKKVKVTVHNDGGQDATDVVVRLYAGNPAAGGAALATATLTGKLAAGDKRSQVVAIQVERDVKLYAEVDPDDAIVECSEGNNDASWDDIISCAPILF